MEPVTAADEQVATVDPLPAGHEIEKLAVKLPVIIETAFFGVSSAIARRVILPVPEAPVIKETLNASAQPTATEIEQPVSEVSSAIVTRDLLPNPAAPVVVETVPAPPDTAVAVVETMPAPVVETKRVERRVKAMQIIEPAWLQVASAIVGRRLLPVPTAPVAESPQQEQTSAAQTEIAIPTSEVSAAIVNREILPVPNPPVVEVALTVPEQEYTAVVEPQPVAEPEAAKPAVRYLPIIDAAWTSVSSAIFGRKLSPLPAAPVASEPSMPSPTVAAVENKPVVITEKQTAAVVQPIPAAKTAPVLINGQTAYSPAMLMPLDIGPQPETKTFSEMVSSNRGPTIEASIAKDSYADLKATEKAKTGNLPALISAKSEFSVDMLKPLNTNPVYPPNPFSVISTQSQQGGYCDPKFVGPPIRFAQTVELRLDDLLGQLNSRFGVNFIVGPGISNLPLNVKAGSIPWNVLLRSQLYVSGVRAKCIPGSDTIELVLNDKVGDLEKGQMHRSLC